MRSEQEVCQAIRRLCLLHLKNEADTEDIFQTVFLKYTLSDKVFDSEEHEKAWIIRVTINACRDFLRNMFRRAVSLEDISEQAAAMPPDHREVLEAVLALPQKYRTVIYLHYYEEYSAPQIGQMLHKNVNTIYTLLSRGRNLLREKLGGDEHEGSAESRL